MHYQTFIPHDLLKPYVKYFWLLEGDRNNQHTTQRILPDGCMELIVNYGDLFKRIHQNDNAEIQPRSFIHGQIRNYIDIQPIDKVGIVGARFFPSRVSPFVRLPVAELNDRAVSLEDIFGNEANRIEERILNEPSASGKIQIAEAFLIQKLLANEKMDYVVERCVNMIIKAKGQVALHELIKQIRISERHLERKFISFVGLSPKSFQRITRFQHVLQLIKQNHFSSFESFSYESGYYDQSHFVKDFKAFTGVNPVAYFTGNNVLSDFFTSES